MGVAAVAVYSELDRAAPHVARAGEAYNLGDGPGRRELPERREDRRRRRAGRREAIHPGYGFLAENAPFAQACEDAGIVFIGPPASAIEAMGSKTRARELMQEAGVPIVPGTTEPVATSQDALRIAKARHRLSGRGQGRGRRRRQGHPRRALEEELEGAFEGASREGEKFFSDATVYLERYLPDPRHVEIQVLADRQGNVIHLVERDCSIQRRHQKVIEESPGAGRSSTGAARAHRQDRRGRGQGGRLLRRRHDRVAARRSGEYFFLEMNTRLQVEHCVTEMTTGIDIVKEGIRAAAGEPLSYAQDDVELRGHAIECRINAEDASKGLRRRPGGSAPTASRAVLACASTRACGRAQRCRRCTTRWSPS